LGRSSTPGASQPAGHPTRSAQATTSSTDGPAPSPDFRRSLNDFIALNKFLSYETRVTMTQRNGHRPTPESNAQVIAFFEHFLKEEATGK
jgi:hypothetical protein